MGSAGFLGLCGDLDNIAKVVLASVVTEDSVVQGRRRGTCRWCRHGRCEWTGEAGAGRSEARGLSCAMRSGTRLVVPVSASSTESVDRMPCREVSTESQDH